MILDGASASESSEQDIESAIDREEDGEECEYGWLYMKVGGSSIYRCAMLHSYLQTIDCINATS